MTHFDRHGVSCPCHQDRNLLRHGTIRRLNLRQLLIRSRRTHFADPAVHHHPLGSRIVTCDGGKPGPRNFAIHMWARVGPPHRQRGQIPMSPLVDFHSPSVQVYCENATGHTERPQAADIMRLHDRRRQLDQAGGHLRHSGDNGQPFKLSRASNASATHACRASRLPELPVFQRIPRKCMWKSFWVAS